MKKRWNEPEILVQQFVPNEYVAACGDSGTQYYFECNAGKGVTHWMGLGKTKYIWDVVTDDGRCLTNNGYYGPCEKKHVADSDDEFLHGYMDDVYTLNDEHIEVIIWTENGTNVHCTTNLDQKSWETAKS